MSVCSWIIVGVSAALIVWLTASMMLIDDDIDEESED